MSDDGELIPVLVPRTHLGPVYRLIGELEAGVVNSNSPRRSEQLWTPELLRRAFDESSEPMRTVLKFLAARPDETVPSSELITALGTGATQNTLAGTLGAFGRRVANRYQMRDERGSILPWRFRWDPSFGSIVYEMPADAASVISDL